MRIFNKYIKMIKEYIRIKKLLKYKNKEKVIFLFTPDHGNLGDQMIGISSSKLIKDKHKDKKVIEIMGKAYHKNKKMIFELINENDIIYLHGGGNLGDIFLGAENERREIISKFPNNKIIIMPQTIFFKSKIEENISKEIYSIAKNLTILTREEYSFKEGKRIFNKNNIILVPDSVFYLEDEYTEKFNNNRNGVLFLLRKDGEKTVDINSIKKIEEFLKKKKIDYEYSDTVIKSKGRITVDTREIFCNKLLSKMKSKELIVTDRLHGMILSFLVNTPVIVFGSSTPKTKGSFNWLKNFKYISYIDDIKNENFIFLEIERLKNIKIEKKEYILKKILKDIFFKI